MYKKATSDIEKSINGTLWMTMGSALNYITNLVITYVLARLLTAQDYGEVSAIATLVGLADIFWQIGVGQAIIQKKNLKDKDITTGFYLNTALGFFVLLIICLFSDFWASVFSISSVPMLRVYSLVFVFNGIMAIPTALLQRELRFKSTSIAEIISHLIYGVFVMIFAYAGMGQWALVFGMLIRYGSKALIIISMRRMNYNIKLISLQSGKELLGFGGGFTIGKVFNYIANNGDYFVINKTLGKVSLGNYQKSYNLLMYPANLIGSTLESVFYPIFSKNQDDNKRLGRAFIAGNVLIALLAMPISTVAYLIAKPLVLLFLGERWAAIIPPFQIMILGLFFRTAYKFSIAMLKAKGKVYQNAAIQGVYALMVVLGTCIGQFYGLTGVAVGVTLAFTANYFILLLTNEHYVKFGLFNFVKDMGVPVFYLAVVLFLLPILSKGWNNFESYFIQCVLCTVFVFSIYYSIFWFTRKKMLSKETNEMFDKVLAVLANKLYIQKLPYKIRG